MHTRHLVPVGSGVAVAADVGNIDVVAEIVSEQVGLPVSGPLAVKAVHGSSCEIDATTLVEAETIIVDLDELSVPFSTDDVDVLVSMNVARHGDLAECGSVSWGCDACSEKGA